MRAMTAMVFAGCVLAAGAAEAYPALTTAPTTMRASPSFHAAVVQSIPANAEIEVNGCGQVWCSASWRDLSGFVHVTVVGAPPVDMAAPPPVYAPPPVVIAPPIAPYYGWGWRPGWGGYGYGYRHYY